MRSFLLRDVDAAQMPCNAGPDVPGGRKYEICSCYLEADCEAAFA
jgi:hypothetical protein